MSWNLNMLLRSDIAWTVLKTVCIRLTIRLQRHILRPMERKDLKSILTCLYCNKYNEINMWHSDTQNRFLFLFLVLCSEFYTLIFLIFDSEGWQLWHISRRYIFPKGIPLYSDQASLFNTSMWFAKTHWEVEKLVQMLALSSWKV